MPLNSITKAVSAVLSVVFLIAVGWGLEKMFSGPVGMAIWTACAVVPLMFWAWQYSHLYPSWLRKFLNHPAPYAAFLAIFGAALWGSVHELRNKLPASASETRRLSLDQVNIIQHSLRNSLSDTAKMAIIPDLICADCGIYSLDLINAFRGVSKVDIGGGMTTAGPNNPDPTGLTINVGDPNNLTKSETAIVGALTKAGVQFGFSRRQMDYDVIVINVTPALMQHDGTNHEPRRN